MTTHCITAKAISDPYTDSRRVVFEMFADATVALQHLVVLLPALLLTHTELSTAGPS
jgi:hypothetical protein